MDSYHPNPPPAAARAFAGSIVRCLFFFMHAIKMLSVPAEEYPKGREMTDMGG